MTNLSFGMRNESDIVLFLHYFLQIFCRRIYAIKQLPI